MPERPDVERLRRLTRFIPKFRTYSETEEGFGKIEGAFHAEYPEVLDSFIRQLREDEWLQKAEPGEEWTEEESSDVIYTGPEELNCGDSFRITAAGFGASEAEAIKDAQGRADAGAEHHCPAECPEVRIDWDVDRCDETEDTSWMCLGTGVYECREQ